MFHAIAIGPASAWRIQHRETSAWRFAAWAFLVGIILFCGLLKVLTFADPQWNWLGAIVPIGGVSMIVGWLAFANLRTAESSGVRTSAIKTGPTPRVCGIGPVRLSVDSCGKKRLGDGLFRPEPREPADR